MKAPGPSRGPWPEPRRGTYQIDVDGLLRRDRARARASAKRERKAARGSAASSYSRGNGAGDLVKPTTCGWTGGNFARVMPDEVKPPRNAKAFDLRMARVASSARTEKAAGAPAEIGPATRAALRRKSGAR